jgi:hypothetical protein
LADPLAQLRESSPLIVITHQKRTMENADAPYGVSMLRGRGLGGRRPARRGAHWSEDRSNVREIHDDDNGCTILMEGGRIADEEILQDDRGCHRRLPRLASSSAGRRTSDG